MEFDPSNNATYLGVLSAAGHVIQLDDMGLTELTGEASPKFHGLFASANIYP